ncbi:SpoIIE family protein phosphatase [Paratractidigestivibacter sp.]|uniref:SpoIIE family protein phosphatase n=2 Tax=Paratractidigestivibacter sp. TaxID=2847316 RepID=UPI002AC91645|nr:SpoIIE family protein phosphatase [Paratractidigestivibacter sp.]
MAKAKNALARHHMEGIGEGSLVGTLSRLLQLTSDAVLIFDGAGRVLLANEEAAEVFACAGDALVGAEVAAFFPVLEDVSGLADGSAREGDEALAGIRMGLPFPVDGTSTPVMARAADGGLRSLMVRCESVQAPGETYLLVACPGDAETASDRGQERATEDLKRANRRLSGAFNIVLDTLDAKDVGELFGRTLKSLYQTMEADATVVYLAGSDGLHLRGVSGDVEVARVPRFMHFGQAIDGVAARAGRAVRLRVAAPSGDALRKGRLTLREVINEDTREVVKIQSRLLPPFTSFVVVPVWFDGQVIAIIEVGWKRQHPVLKEDARLLDSVARYLAVQLAGAFATLQAQRRARLDETLADLREEVLGLEDDEDPHKAIVCVMEDAADELEAAFVELEVDEGGAVRAELPLTGACELSCDLEEVLDGHESDGIAVAPLSGDTGLGRALRDLGEPCEGVLLDGGVVAGKRRCCLMLRPDGAEPFDDVEQAFLARLISCARDVARGEQAHIENRRISQALQTGMRNELQAVDGITAQGVYSSATASAFVGGDFYDLIRLPERRACVIMGDVSGKGIEAASVSAAVKTALGAYAWEGLAPARMVRALNDFLLGFSRVETFATLFVGIVDLGAATITYCSAGHPPAILVRAGASEMTLLDVQSGVVGAFKGIAYQDGVARLSEGDVLLLYTDGTTEARDGSGAFFGEQGLRDMVMEESGPGKTYDGFLDRLLAHVEDFTGHKLEDDVAMVSLRFDALG